jgi:hypothetical protein
VLGLPRVQLACQLHKLVDRLVRFFAFFLSLCQLLLQLYSAGALLLVQLLQPCEALL